MESQIDKITNEQLDKIALESNFEMNSLQILIPYLYVSKLVSLNWYDILFAIDNGFMSHQSAIEHASFELVKHEDSDQLILDLACLSTDKTIYPYSIHPYIDELANFESVEKKLRTKDKIMYVLLNWVYEHKEFYEDPLKVVEFIYDDFHFPKSIVNFVRYKPIDQTLLGSIEANVERLYDNWKIFLDNHKLNYLE